MAVQCHEDNDTPEHITETVAVIRPQFDDDLYSSRWRFQMHWKITILISAE